jgi:sec-independent protein translocase protein TatB
MHLGDSIFILILALVLLGPKKTAQLAQQLGKLMAEFRKASNDFKFQFNEEMRVNDQQEQKRKQEDERAALPAGDTTADTAGEENSILHGAAEPGLPGEAAASAPSEAVPYAISATTGEEHPVEDHPLLRVDVIPPMDGSPADQNSPTAQTPPEASAEADPITEDAIREENGAPVQHG